MKNYPPTPRKNDKYSIFKSTALFVLEGKNDYLLIGLIFLLLAFFLIGMFFMK